MTATSSKCLLLVPVIVLVIAAMGDKRHVRRGTAVAERPFPTSSNPYAVDAVESFRIEIWNGGIICYLNKTTNPYVESLIQFYPKFHGVSNGKQPNFLKEPLKIVSISNIEACRPLLLSAYSQQALAHRHEKSIY